MRPCPPPSWQLYYPPCRTTVKASVLCKAQVCIKAFVCLFVHTCPYQPACLLVSLSVRPIVRLSICLSVSVSLPVCPCLCQPDVPFASLHILNVCLSVSQLICMCACVPVLLHSCLRQDVFCPRRTCLFLCFTAAFILLDVALHACAAGCVSASSCCRHSESNLQAMQPCIDLSTMKLHVCLHVTHLVLPCPDQCSKLSASRKCSHVCV